MEEVASIKFIMFTNKRYRERAQKIATVDLRYIISADKIW